MKMVDLGRKSEAIAAESPVSGSNVYYPSLYIEKYPSELTEKEIGSVCRLEVEVKITGRSIREGKDGKKENIDLDILKIGYIGQGGKKTRDEYVNMTEKEREEYDRAQVVEGKDDD